MPLRPTFMQAALLLLASTLVVESTALAAPVPLTPPRDAAPLSAAYQARHHRMIEAETKARVWTKSARVAPAATDNMNLYDVIHYDLDLELDPVIRMLYGSVTVTATVVGETITEVDLDLYGNMTISGATAAGAPTTFSHVNQVVTIDLDRTYATGETFTVSVTYSGDPASDAFSWSSFGGADWIWTLSEPFGARRWWACKNVNDDKADAVDIRVTVPDNGLIVASNGLLVSEVDNGSTRTFHWHEGYPIATYLVSLAIHPFATFSHWYHYAPGDSMELQYYVLPHQLDNALLGYPVTVDMLHWFAQGFGEYPFVDEKYGHAHFNWGGGMEHQTLTSLKYTSYNPWLISHELAHQWWGDMITCADFHHIWLNEGFATWSEAYWRELGEGMAGYHAEMNLAAFYGSGTIYVEDPSDFGSIFYYWTTYAKASWVVHMLRHVLGDEGFFAALAAYREAYAYGSATTEQFRDVCEASSGLDLHPFFQQWIYGEFYPQYAYSWYALADGDATQVQLKIAQVQINAGLFTMPIDVTITTDQGVFDFVAQNSLAEEFYSYAVTGNVLMVELDRDEWILKTVTETAVDVPTGAVVQARLLPNHPNPFNPLTTIRFVIPTAGPVRLTLYDLTGRSVRDLIDESFAAGEHSIVWDGRDATGERVASGTYFYRLELPGWSATRKMTLLK